MNLKNIDYLTTFHEQGRVVILSFLRTSGGSLYDQFYVETLSGDSDLSFSFLPAYTIIQYNRCSPFDLPNNFSWELYQISETGIQTYIPVHYS